MYPRFFLDIWSRLKITNKACLIAVMTVIAVVTILTTPQVSAFSCCGDVNTGTCEVCGGPGGCWGCGSGPGSTCYATAPSCGWENGSCSNVGGGHTVEVDFCDCPENASQCSTPTCDENSCGSWGPNSGCGQMGCAEDEKHQVRSCSDSNCQVERCQHYDSCVGTPTPTLGTVLNLVGSCSQFGGPINLSWSYAATSGQYFKISRSYTNGGYVENFPNHATTAISPVPVRNFTDTRGATNSIYPGPYTYRVTPCYDAANCGTSSQQEAVVCPTVAPLANFDAQCIYPYDRIRLDWTQSNPAPPFAETNRHLARIVGGNSNLRYRSFAGTVQTFTDAAITPGVSYGYNIRRCYTEYGTGSGECRYNGPYTGQQQNEVCRIQAQCLNTTLTYGAGCDVSNGCYRGGLVQSYQPHGYNGDSSQPPPFNSGLGFSVNSNTKVGTDPPVSCNGVNCTNYAIPYNVPLGETIYFKTNVQWIATSSICLPGSTWYNNSPPHPSSTCSNGCTASVPVICNPNVWGNWSICSPFCTQFRSSECGVTESRVCSGGNCVPATPPPGSTATPIPPTSTPVPPTNTPPPGSTFTPVPPTVTSPPGATFTPVPTSTLIPTIPINTITPTRTHTPTQTSTPSPTPIGYTDVRVDGQFQQKTGAYIRTAPGQLSGTNLPIDIVQILSLQSHNTANGVPNCHENPLCENLPPGSSGYYAQYRCVVALPGGCVIDSPQTFYAHAIMRFPYSLSYDVDDTPITVVGSPPPTSFTAPVTLYYTRNTGWVKFIGSDAIRSSSAIFTNAIPLITDRYNPSSGGVPYVTGDSIDMGHASMIDVFTDGEVGGLMGGDVNLLPSESSSQFGGHITGYVLGGNSVTDLISYVGLLLVTKPITEITPPPGGPEGVDIALNGTNTYVYKAGNILINRVTLQSGSKAILVVADQNGNLADVTFNNNITADPNTSFMVIARNITLADTVSEVNAVFVSSELFSTGAGNTPLKITGNITALGGMVQGRARGDLDHARPTVLIVMRPRTYFDLMPLLSIKDSKYTVVE